MARVTLVRKGVRELLKSQAVADLCASLGQDMARRAGEGYEAAPPHQTGQRAAVNVYAGTREARRDNLENNTLLKAMGGGMR